MCRQEGKLSKPDLVYSVKYWEIPSSPPPRDISVQFHSYQLLAMEPCITVRPNDPTSAVSDSHTYLNLGAYIHFES